MKFLTVFLFVSFLGALPNVHAQTGPIDAFEQNKRLGRGANILGYDPGYDPIWRSRDQARFQTKHFRLLKQAGFMQRDAWVEPILRALIPGS